MASMLGSLTTVPFEPESLMSAPSTVQLLAVVRAPLTEIADARRVRFVAQLVDNTGLQSNQLLEVAAVDLKFLDLHA